MRHAILNGLLGEVHERNSLWNKKPIWERNVVLVCLQCMKSVNPLDISDTNWRNLVELLFAMMEQKNSSLSSDHLDTSQIGGRSRLDSTVSFKSFWSLRYVDQIFMKGNISMDNKSTMVKDLKEKNIDIFWFHHLMCFYMLFLPCLCWLRITPQICCSIRTMR